MLARNVACDGLTKSFHECVVRFVEVAVSITVVDCVVDAFMPCIGSVEELEESASVVEAVCTRAD